tara:strand:- start:40335 stop:41993 length:1659 start_codon:yes stop_codon:yes gene_type:complete
MKPTVKQFNSRLKLLTSERSSFIPIYQELSDNHLAHRGRFLTDDYNKGHKRNTKQINNTSRLASRTLASGMMAGITSPARPWFRLSTSDPRLKDNPDVVSYLHRVQQIMYEVFAQSNTYNSLHTLYAELGVFGTAVMGVFNDFENVIRCRPYTAGSYTLGMNGLNIVDTMYREFEYTVGQCVKEFGIENCSEHVRDQWAKGNTEFGVKLVHVVEPNDDREQMSPMARDKAVRSVYYEVGASTLRSNQFLRESGFDTFPILSPRWEVTGEDVYATDCPGMTALGDAKMLQLGERRLYQALDRMVDPPLQGPAALVRAAKSLRSGDKLATTDPTGLRSIYDDKPDLAVMEAINNKVERRISRAFYEDLFLMLANSDRSQITAREVAEKHEEKLLMLGPVLERLHSELLDPLIDRTFDILQENGVLPVPPEALQNSELKVEYVSVLAQAQRMVSVSAIEQITAFAGQMTQIWPEARHKIDASQSIDEYANALGVNPSIIRSDDDVAALVAAEQQAAAQAQAMEQGQQMADTAQTISNTDTAEGGTIDKLMQNAGA